MDIVKEWENVAHCTVCSHKLCGRCLRAAQPVERQLEEHEEEAIIYKIPLNPIPEELLGRWAVCCACGCGDFLARGWIGPQEPLDWLISPEEQEFRSSHPQEPTEQQVRREEIAEESEASRGINQCAVSGFGKWVFVPPEEN